MPSPLHAQRPIVRTDQLICEDVSGECVIYDARQKTAHHLNSTLTWIWYGCDGSTTIEQLAAAFEQQFHVTNGVDAVLTGLEQLESRKLLEHRIEIPAAMVAENSSVSRRAVVVGGSVLMPVIASILAPTPAAAKSKEKDKKDKKD